MTTTMTTVDRWVANIIHGKNAKGRQRPDDQYWYRGNILFSGNVGIARLEQDVHGKWCMIKREGFYGFAYENGRPSGGDYTAGLLPTFAFADIGAPHAHGEADFHADKLTEHLLAQTEYRARDLLRLAKDLGIAALLMQDGTDADRTNWLRSAAAEVAKEYDRFRCAFRPDMPPLFDVSHDLHALIETRRRKYLDPKAAQARLRAKARRIAIQALGLRRAS